MPNPRFFLEMAILCLFPLPYYDFYVKTHRSCSSEYIYSQLVVAFMWLRCFFLLRSILNYHIYTTEYSKYMCQSYGINADTRFTLKCWLKANPIHGVFGMLFFTIFSFAYLLRIFELPNFSTGSESKVGLQSF